MEYQNQFSRIKGNEAKLGAFYTDTQHCMDIASYLKFSTEDETCVLEPSIGDGNAVRHVTGSDGNKKVRIFGVELNDKTYTGHLKDNDAFEDVLKADFLSGVRIKNGVFSFCFGNPPYLNDAADEEGVGLRVERQFLEKVTGYLKIGAILVWVIPYSSFMEDGAFRYFHTRYELLHVMRFRPEEYRKWKQVVIIARKVQAHMTTKEELQEQRQHYADLATIPELPRNPVVPEGEKIEVPTSDSANMTLFAAKEFDVDAALFSVPNTLRPEMMRFFDERIAVPPFVVNNIGRPPIPLKKDSMYLLAVSGSGQGMTGSVENHDLHLQRGVAEVVEEVVNQDDDNGKSVAVVTTRTQITMTVIENDGKISTFQ